MFGVAVSGFVGSSVSFFPFFSLLLCCLFCCLGEAECPGGPAFCFTLSVSVMCLARNGMGPKSTPFPYFEKN